MPEILQICTSDSLGGAARAAWRTHEALNRYSDEWGSRFYTKINCSGDASVVTMPTRARRIRRVVRSARRCIIRCVENHIRIKSAYAGERIHSGRSEWTLETLSGMPNSDLLHLHWVHGFLDIPHFVEYAASNGKKLVWTFHDMSVMTGGFAYDWNRGQPLDSPHRDHLLVADWTSARLVSYFYRSKAKAFEKLEDDQLCIIAPSQWMAQRVQDSQIMKRFRVETIPNGIDTDIYAPRGKQQARHQWGIDCDAFVVLLIASDIRHRRKGVHLLAEELTNRATLGDRVTFVAAGQSSGDSDKSFPFQALGRVHSEDQLVSLYNAADLMLCTSLEDNLPNTVMESMACGTPVLAFASGGIPEMIDHEQTGWVVPQGDSKSMLNWVERLCSEHKSLETAGRAAREFVLKHYALKQHASALENLYRTL